MEVWTRVPGTVGARSCARLKKTECLDGTSTVLLVLGKDVATKENTEFILE